MKKFLFSVVALVCFSLSSFAGVEKNSTLVSPEGCHYEGWYMIITTRDAQGFLH